MNSILSSSTHPNARQEEAVRTEICSLSSVRRVAAMLDLEPDAFELGADLPRGWQFLLMAADTKRSQLRADGFPGLGVPMPDLGLPRLMLGGRTVAYISDIPIGAAVTRRSCIRNITQKTNQSGPLAIATIEHELTLTECQTLALVETQTYLLLPASKGGSAVGVSKHPDELTGQFVKTVVPDETLIFQYSALGFNSHKIHIDRSHARNVEGFPDLVVNGGLATLLMTEFLRHDVNVQPAGIKVRHIAPLFCGSPITMVAKQLEGKWQIQAYDHRFILAIDMEVDTHEL
jgi:3-methylfumaryl-CoA hydratase